MLVQKPCLFLLFFPISILSSNPKYEGKKAFQQKGFQFWNKDKTKCFLLPCLRNRSDIFAEAFDATQI